MPEGIITLHSDDETVESTELNGYDAETIALTKIDLNQNSSMEEENAEKNVNQYGQNYLPNSQNDMEKTENEKRKKKKKDKKKLKKSNDNELHNKKEKKKSRTKGNPDSTLITTIQEKSISTSIPENGTTTQQNILPPVADFFFDNVVEISTVIMEDEYSPILYQDDRLCVVR